MRHVLCVRRAVDSSSRSLTAWSKASEGIGRMCSRTDSSARRARAWGRCTRTPTGCACRSSDGVISSWSPDGTSYLLILGADPMSSNGSLMTAPDMRGRLRDIRKRGGKVVVVDPRRSATADAADEHFFIRPGTDALFLFAVAHVLFADRLTA